MHHSSAMNAHVISIRSRTDTNNVYSALDDLVTFRNNSFGVFWGAMDKELYRYSFVARAIAVLAEKYGLDLKQFNFHSSYIVLRKDAYRTAVPMTLP
uniref:Uncharacterized protein n=1 Tax=Ditylenchus dipsaci TaxID=166011 RepID=A0A915D9V5_9BILA